MSFRRFTDLCEQLLSKDPDLTLWAASFDHDGRPPRLNEVIMGEPLRSPPSVTREVQKSDRFRTGRVYGYDASSGPLHSDGPAPIVVYHTAQHAARSPVDCQQCGKKVARVLRDTLQVGAEGVCV